ncbi:MAG: lytic transglycosylase domain-containing protein [Solirubrobacteraceae bacterium]
MSTEAIGAASTPLPAEEQAISARIRQIEAMIEEARDGALGLSASSAASASSSTSFASALQSAGAGASATAAAYQPESSTSGGEYKALIAQAAQRNGIEPAVLHGLIEQESGFDPSSQSSAGAMGLTQLMPGTASSLGVANPLDPAESIEGGARYLGKLMREFAGNTTDALAAYNAGPAAVSQHGGVPPYPETEAYVSKVLAYAEAFRQTHPATAPPAASPEELL